MREIGAKISRGPYTLIFGDRVILSRLEAERPKRDTSPAEGCPPQLCDRKITLEGYITSAAGADRIARVRELFSRIVTWGESFTLTVGERWATLCDGGLIFPREAPFSGETGEHFILTATLVGGYFKGKNRTVSVRPTVEGISFPGSITGVSTTGTEGLPSCLFPHNPGEVEVGFAAEFSPTATVSGFSLTDEESGFAIGCDVTFGSGDIIKISTLASDPYFLLVRGSATVSLTGRATDDTRFFGLSPGPHRLNLGAGAAFEGSLTLTPLYGSY